MIEDLHLKYRPQKFEDVIGQGPVVNSLKELTKLDNIPHAFLFHGPSGVGKTTLARILSNVLGCESSSLVEVDAATNTGIDAMRALTNGLQFTGFGSNPRKMVIVDEAHALSAASWKSLLKIVEEPPPHIYWSFCTTEIQKVPETILTRTHAYSLKPVDPDSIFNFLVSIAENEGSVEVSEDVVSVIASECQGSVRQALVYLSMCRKCLDAKEASQLIRFGGVLSKEVVDLCRWLVAGRALSWKSAMDYVKALKDESPETIRLAVTGYLTAVLTGASDESQVLRLLYFLECFSATMNYNDKMAPIVLALGKCLFSGQTTE